MENYDNRDNIREREQVVEITLQSGEFKGTLRSTITGRQFGLNVFPSLDEDIIYNLEDWEQNSCTIVNLGEDDEGEEWVKYKLTREDGETCVGECFIKEFTDMIVGINIVDCKVIKKS